MSDLNFSYSFGSSSPTSDAQQPLYSFNSVKVLPCVGNTVTLHHTQTQHGMLVQSEVAHALSFCGPFRSMEAHLDEILAAMPPLRDHPEDARNILANVRDAGFLESSEDAWRRLKQDAPPDNQSPARIFILTCDRPEALQRLLESLADAEFDPSIESVWIIDDSRQPESKNQNAEIISIFSGRLPVAVNHVNDALQKKLLEHLTKHLPQHKSSVSFLLDPNAWPNSPTFGRARNLSLLLSLGFRGLVLDDDIILEAIAPPLSQRILNIGKPGDREARFYESPEELMTHALGMGESPLSLMLKSLGQTAGELISSQLPDHSALAGWDGEILRRYTANSPVILSQCGTWGDPGMGDGGWIFFLPKTSIENLVDAKAQLGAMLNAGASWVGYRGPTLTEFGIMTAVTGLDHRKLLPPYFPAGRGEDLLFGVMLQRLHPDSLVLSEGWSIRHEPVDQRSGRGHLKPLNANLGLHTLVDWLGREPDEQRGLTPERRLHLLSTDVRTLSELDAESLEQLVGTQLASKRTSLLARCMGHAEDLGNMATSPNLATWSEFISQTQAKLITALQEPEAEPIGNALSRHDQADWALLRDMGNRLADSLAAWPEICAEAGHFKP